MGTTKEVSALISEATKSAIKHGYKSNSMKKIERCWLRLSNYCSQRGILEYSPQIGLDFLEYEGCMIPEIAKILNHRGDFNAILHLDQYQLFGIIKYLKPTKRQDYCGPYYKVLSDFKTHQKEYHDISPITITNYEKAVSAFFLYLEEHTIELESLKPRNVLDYCDTFAGCSTSNIHNTFGILRVFFRFLQKHGFIEQDLSTVVPSSPHTRNAKLPSLFSSEEIERILAAIDLASPIGKRDYAILLMAYRLGFRSGDIRLLTFPSIHWDEDTIEIISQKNKKQITFPLLPDVGNALINYIEHGRPKCKCETVFVTHEAPIRPFTTSAALSGILKLYSNKAGIESIPGQRRCMHAFRGTLASALLEKDVPLPIISEILLHSDTKTTTSYYLRIGIPQLRRCSLKVPQLIWAEDEKEAF